jgi:hypothetical protein
MNPEQIDFDDIFGLWELQWWQKPWVWVGLILGTCLFMVLLRFCIKRYRARRAFIDPRERALAQLAAMKPTKMLETQDEYKKFYVSLFFILKEYFDARYNLACSGKTDRELVSYISQQYQIAQYQEIIQLLVDHSFFIKFAHDSSTYERVVADYEMVLSMLVHEPLPQKR